LACEAIGITRLEALSTTLDAKQCREVLPTLELIRCETRTVCRGDETGKNLEPPGVWLAWTNPSLGFADLPPESSHTGLQKSEAKFPNGGHPTTQAVD
jgi:hypothetical protein